MLGRSRWGEEGSPGSSHRPSAVASCRHRAVYEQKKVPVLPLPPQISRVQLPGSGATLLQYSLFSRIGAFRSQQQAFSSVRGQDTGSASRADAATRVFSAVCRPGSPHRSVILWRVPRAPPAGAAGSGGAEHRFEVRGRTRPGLLRRGSPGRGYYRHPGQARVAVHEDEDGGPDRKTDHSDQPQRHGLGQDAADHEGGEQGDRDRVGSHGHRPPLARPGRHLIRRGRHLIRRGRHLIRHGRHLIRHGRLPTPRSRLPIRRGVRHHSRHLLPQCLPSHLALSSQAHTRRDGNSRAPKTPSARPISQPQCPG